MGQDPLSFFSSFLRYAQRKSEASKEITGGYSSIKDPCMIQRAEFTVFEYNKQSNTCLKLVDVVKGDRQMVAGTNYRLLLKTADGHTTKAYEAIVSENLRENFKKLTSFELVKS